ncbi:2-oxo-tetronate isomerase [Methylopila turkensis]|uniref:Hydroxypyruvate isomerase n=1 Tax=Methylopila turkensis TaxID=1437816 RepID=A0A9W6N826_9HYPH|nr:2-oxo-tetronate isomerase [Methylopila turkensis]GLK81012.1 hydroxypyruvate isomerase [Methylopila turkensis]
MPRFAANLTMMFNERPFLDRFAAAADAGFTAVEFLFPYDHAPDVVAAKLQAADLTQALFNMPPGDWAAGERGIAALPGREAEFDAGVDTAMAYAEATGVKRLHMMAGLVPADDPAANAAYRRAVRVAAEKLAEKGVDLLLEPINGRDMLGYFLNDFGKAAEIIAELNLPNVKLQYDVYHRQILHGDVLVSLEAMLPIVGHVQIASVPKRNEPNTGELNDSAIFAALDRLGYDGFVGCEYRPAGVTEDGLGWLRPHQAS